MAVKPGPVGSRNKQGTSRARTLKGKVIKPILGLILLHHHVFSVKGGEFQSSMQPRNMQSGLGLLRGLQGVECKVLGKQSLQVGWDGRRNSALIKRGQMGLLAKSFRIFEEPICKQMKEPFLDQTWTGWSNLFLFPALLQTSTTWVWKNNSEFLQNFPFVYNTSHPSSRATLQQVSVRFVAADTSMHLWFPPGPAHCCNNSKPHSEQ